MSFEEWLSKRHGRLWSEVKRKESLMKVAEYAFQYDAYCHSKGINPLWTNS